MVRADYRGSGEAHTQDGTSIDNYDDVGLEYRGAPDDASYVFEAGWSPQGAMCVNYTRLSADPAPTKPEGLQPRPALADRASLRNSGGRSGLTPLLQRASRWRRDRALVTSTADRTLKSC